MNGARTPLRLLHASGRSPIVRLEPGNPLSPLVGVTHDDCWQRFLEEVSALPSQAVAR